MTKGASRLSRLFSGRLQHRRKQDLRADQRWSRSVHSLDSARRQQKQSSSQLTPSGLPCFSADGSRVPLPRERGPSCDTHRNGGGAFRHGIIVSAEAGGEIQLQFKLAPCNNESCRVCDTRYARAARSSLRNIRLACARETRSHVMHSRGKRARVAGAIFAEACKISGRPPTRVIRGRDVKPSSGNLHSRRRPRRTYGNIESEVTFTTSSPLFLACCQARRGTTRHRNRADIRRSVSADRSAVCIYFMALRGARCQISFSFVPLSRRAKSASGRSARAEVEGSG